METKSKIREQFSTNELNNNYNEIVNKVNKIIKERDYQIKINTVKSDLIYLKPDFNNLSKNARKNMAKRLYFLDGSYSRKAINVLFLVAFRLGVIDEKVYVDLGDKEKEIQNKRKMWKISRDKAQEALDAYKKEKSDFYKKKVV